jgi:hypothetical protein
VPGPAEPRRIGFGPLWAQISASDRSKFALELGRMIWLSCPDRPMPIVQPPALPTGLRASLRLATFANGRLMILRPPVLEIVHAEAGPSPYILRDKAIRR